LPHERHQTGPDIQARDKETRALKRPSRSAAIRDFRSAQLAVPVLGRNPVPPPDAFRFRHLDVNEGRMTEASAYDPKMTWCYTETDGRLLGFALRFDPIDDKPVQTLALWRGGTTGFVEFVAGGRGLVALVAYLFPSAVVSFGELLAIDAYE
jgi:hypothetical protein